MATGLIFIEIKNSSLIFISSKDLRHLLHYWVGHILISFSLVTAQAGFRLQREESDGIISEVFLRRTLLNL